MRLVKIQGSAPRPPSGMGRGMVTPVTDLKRRTMSQYPYTEEAKEGMWRTPVRYHVVEDDPSRAALGRYYDVRAKDNRWRRLVGMQEKPEIEVYRYNQAMDQRSLGHEYAHKYYFSEPDVAKDWVQNAPEDSKQQAWESYGTAPVRERLENEPQSWFKPYSNPREAESYATAAEKTYKVWRPDERERYFGRLYDEVKIQKEKETRLAVVNPANVQQPKQAQAQAQDQRTSWASSRKGEY